MMTGHKGVPDRHWVLPLTNLRLSLAPQALKEITLRCCIQTQVARSMRSCPNSRILNYKMAACLAIQRLKRRRENSYLYTNEASLYELAQCGCYYCRVLCEARPEYASLDEVYLELLDTALNATYFQEHHGSKRSLLREFFVLDCEYESLGWSRSNNNTAQDDPIIPTARHIPGNTGSRQSFKTINDWLDTCIKTHQGLCLASRSENATLPDRAIEVSLNMPRRIRLVDTKNREGRYACLSHCWGDKQPLRTTLKPYTLSIHQENIREEDLPKTFRDAITVSLSIGIQYIWIDSLCVGYFRIDRRCTSPC
jgi:hypothetical protein